MKGSIVIVYAVAILMFSGCKKYPENVLLLVPPEMALKQLSGAKLKIIKVNGYDSTIVLERKWERARDREFIYDPYLAPRSSSFYRNYTWGCSNCKGEIIMGTIYLYDNQKTLEGGTPFNVYGIVKWKIVKLTFRELKLEATKNNVLYEMEFSK